MDRYTHYYKVPAFIYKYNEICMCPLIISELEDQHVQESNGNSDQLLTVFGASFWHYDNKSLIKLNISTKQVLVWRCFANIHMYAEVKPDVHCKLQWENTEVRSEYSFTEPQL